MMQQRKMKIFIPMLLALMLVFAGSTMSWAGYKGFVRDKALITPQQLKELIDKKDPHLVILAVANIVDYRLGHIPGALHIWRGDYEPPKDKPYPYGGMILNRIEFEKFARNLGINNDSTVVIYDHKYDATRVWWAFFLYGKTDCKVLDGGFQGWKKAGYDTRMFAPDKPKQGNFVAKPPLAGWTASMDEVWQAKTNPEMQVWDTREKKEWTGATLKRGAFRKGRIPWARFLNWKEFKMPVAPGEKPTAFKTADEIQKVIEKFGMDKNKYQIFYCQSAVRTTTEIFALYLMGWDISKLQNYDGSWIQWSYFKENPVVCDECK